MTISKHPSSLPSARHGGLPPEDFYWLAGLLEANGAFGLTGKGRYPRIRLGSTDADVIRRAAALLGVACYSEVSPNRLPMFRCELSGSRATRLLVELLPLMGARRSSKIAAVLAAADHNYAHAA